MAAAMEATSVKAAKPAAEAMLEGGTLSVRVAHAGDQVRLEISDTGGGIPAGIDIFEPFITTKPQGTGLGLTIVRQIIAAHDGTLTYHSTPGQGTTFTISLPVLRQAQT
jgi:signal transduction histidine kinase